MDAYANKFDFMRAMGPMLTLDDLVEAVKELDPTVTFWDVCDACEYLGIEPGSKLNSKEMLSIYEQRSRPIYGHNRGRAKRKPKVSQKDAAIMYAEHEKGMTWAEIGERHNTSMSTARKYGMGYAFDEGKTEEAPYMGYESPWELPIE
jgi:hypothetical protein